MANCIELREELVNEINKDPNINKFMRKMNDYIMAKMSALIIFGNEDKNSVAQEIAGFAIAMCKEALLSNPSLVNQTKSKKKTNKEKLFEDNDLIQELARMYCHFHKCDECRIGKNGTCLPLVSHDEFNKWLEREAKE